MDILIVKATDELKVEPSDMMGSTFCNYIKAGCQLRVVCAIDATAANGDPRHESSLHCFNENGLHLNEAIYSVLWLYDSDQKYPVYGFGAKRDGVVNQCFSFGWTSEVDGVNGFLKVYRKTFRSGISMSSLGDFSEVKQQMVRHNKAFESRFLVGSRSICAFQKNRNMANCIQFFLIFTSGSAADSDDMVRTIQEVNNALLSIVFNGIGTTFPDFAQVCNGVESRNNL